MNTDKFASNKENIRNALESFAKLSKERQNIFTENVDLLAETMAAVAKQIPQPISADIVSKSINVLANTVKNQTSALSKEYLANTLAELSALMSETAISDIRDLQKVIDKALPALDVLEIPEPQREAVEEYKKSGKISLQDVESIVVIIVTIIQLFFQIYVHFNDSDDSDKPTAQTVINIDNGSADEIMQHVDDNINQISSTEE